MKNIKIIVCILLMQITVSAQSLFNAKEWGLSLATDYNIDPAHAFRDEYQFNLNAGAFYYPWKHFGFDANLPFYSTKGSSFSEFQAGLLARFPLSSNTPILRNIAPYAGLGGVYNWKSVDSFAYLGKIGLEVRLNPHWGIFGEGQYRNNNFDWSHGNTSVNGGLRLVF